MRTILVSFFIVLGFSGWSQSLEVRLASNVWPPFTNVAGEQAFALALVNEALQRAKIVTNTQILEFDEVIAGIRNGNFDGSAALWHNAEREEFMLFSDPYLENRLVLVGRKGSEVTATSFADLKGKRLAVVGSYAYGDELENAEDVQFIPGRNAQENLDRLLRGEVDYMLVDDLLVQYFRKYNEEEVAKFLEIGANALLKRPLHFAVRKNLPKAEFIVDRFNQQIRAMVADGTYHRILEINWIRSDVDGDGQMELVLAGNQAGKVAPTTPYGLPSSSAPQQPEGPVNRYWIDGNLYQGWDNVPENYKVDIPKIEGQQMKNVRGFRF